MTTKQMFKKDVLTIAKELGVNPKEIYIRKMKRKLASCSTKGRLTFDESILIMPKEKNIK